MARSCFAVVVVLLAGFLAAEAAAGAGPLATGGGCAASTLAAALAASCAAGETTAVPPSCCSPVVASVEHGAAFFCRVASETPVLHAGLHAPALLALYTRCGGARIRHACHGTVLTHCCHYVPSRVSFSMALCFREYVCFHFSVGRSRRGSHSGDGVVRALSSTVADGDVPDVAAGVAQPQQQTVVVTRTTHLSSKDRKVLIGLLACQTIQLSVVLGTGMRKLYRHCYGPK